MHDRQRATQVPPPPSYYLRELITAGIDDLEHAHGLVATAEAIRAGRRETRPLAGLMSDLGISREELDALPDQPA